MDNLSDNSAENPSGKQGREEVLLKRAFDVAAGFYPNRKSEHCMALAAAIFSALVDTAIENTNLEIYERGEELLRNRHPRFSQHAREPEGAAKAHVIETWPKPPADKELLDKVQGLVWDKILWPWNYAHEHDRHVSPLFLRSDTVLHHLASLITEQLCAVREDFVAEQVLSPAQREKLEVWRNEQNAKLLAAQQKDHPQRSRPYFGAAGGSLTFQSTPTSMGVVSKVIYCAGTPHEAVLDLTDYEAW